MQKKPHDDDANKKTKKRKSIKQVEKMTEQEKKEWDSLYFYVHDKVMRYDEKTKLSQQMCLRLKGLRKGKMIQNKNIADKAEYPYNVIEKAFVISMPEINRAFSKASFNNEMHKLNMACKIAEKNINDVYERIKMRKLSDSMMEHIDTSAMSHSGASYKRKTKNTLKSLEDLW